MSFTLHPDFEGSTRRLGADRLCQVLLQNDARFVWLILVPRIAGAVEIEDLTPDDRARLWAEIDAAAKRVRAIGEALGRPIDKLNIAALGNVTPQLHVHVIGRRRDDAAWPRPVWGVGEASPWTPERLDLIRAAWTANA